MSTAIMIRAGDRVLFSHVDGKIPATVQECKASPAGGLMVRLSISGWLGTHWFPLSRVELA